MTGSERVGRMSRNAFFNAFRQVVGAIVALATGVVVARSLGPSDAGIYALVAWVSLSIVVVFADGLALTITNSIAQKDARTERPAIGGIVVYGIRLQIVLTLVSATLIVLLSDLLADLFDSPEAERLFVLGALIVVGGALIEIFSTPIYGLERHGLLVPVRTSWNIAHLLGATLVLVVLDLGLRALVLSQGVVWILIAGLHLVVMLGVISLRGTTPVPAEEKREIRRSALSLSVSSTLGLVVFTRSAVFFLGYFATTADVAYYSIAYAMADAVQLLLPTALAFAARPNISRAFATGDIAFAGRAYEAQLRLTALAVAPVAVAGALVSGSVIHVLYGEEFSEASVPLAVLLFAAGTKSLSISATWVLVGSDRQSAVVWIYAGTAAVNLSLGLALVSGFGLYGALVAEAATQLAMVAACIVVVRRVVGFAFPARGIARILLANLPVLASVAIVAALIGSDLLTILVAAVVVPPAYALGLWSFRALNAFERGYLRERLAFVPGI